MLPFSRDLRKANSENRRIRVLKMPQQTSCGRKFSTVAIEGGVGKGLLCFTVFFVPLRASD